MALRAAAPIASAAVIALVSAQPVSAAWTAPFDVSPDVGSGHALAPDVGVDADGDAVLVWDRFDGTRDRIEARGRSKAGVLTAVQTLSAASQGAIEPAVAVDADGDAVFVWVSGSHFYTRARSAAGTLSSIQTLTDDSVIPVNYPQVVVASNGDAVYVWEAEVPGVNYVVQGRRRNAAGVLGPIMTLSPTTMESSWAPDVAVDADGDAVFTWFGYASSQQIKSRARTRALSAAGVLSAMQTVAWGPVGSATVAMIPSSGIAIFAWPGSDGAHFRAQTRVRSAAGALSAVQTLSAPGQDTGQPEVAVDADGDAVYAWERSDGVNLRIQTRTRNQDRTLSPLQNVSHPGYNAKNVEHDVDADGDAVFVWERDGGGVRIQARTRSAAGVFGAIRNVSGIGARSERPRVELDATGNAVTSWQHRPAGAMYWHIQAAAGP